MASAGLEINYNMPNDMKIQQANQEKEYFFPYHYVMQFGNDQFRHFFLDTWAINYGSTVEYLLGKIDAGQDKRIIDIGCGDGRFSRELSLAFESSTVVGIDYSRRAIALASAMNADTANLKFECIDITETHSLGTFDVAVLMEVFEHIPIEDTGKFMKSVRALLSDNGFLYLTVPHANKPVEYTHFQHFTIEKISDCLRPYFEIAEIVPFEKNTWYRAFVLKILSNKLFILNNPHLLSMIYRCYKKRLFSCVSENECQRIFVKAVAR
jgi:2-polyprenyl-3-methyl-5-hydroxy-6-metoxy-1,4-benzoquinol methylase